MAGLLAGGSLQEGTFIGVQHFKGVSVLPNTNHLPLLGPAPTLDGTLEKEAEKDGCHMTERGRELPSIEQCLPELTIIDSVRKSPRVPGKHFWRKSCTQIPVFLTLLCLEWRVGALSSHSLRMLAAGILAPSVKCEIVSRRLSHRTYQPVNLVLSGRFLTLLTVRQ